MPCFIDPLAYEFFGRFLLPSSSCQLMNSLSHPCHPPLPDSVLKRFIFKQTSKGCSIEVNPPGITAKSVFSDFSERFTCSVLCASKAPNTSRLLRRLRPPIRQHQTFSIQIFMISLSIQPFSWTATTTQCLFWIFGIVLRLKMTSGFSFDPSPAPSLSPVVGSLEIASSDVILRIFRKFQSLLA